MRPPAGRPTHDRPGPQHHRARAPGTLARPSSHSGSDERSDRGDWTNAFLTEDNFKIVDIIIDIAKQVDSTPARVALNWVQTQPGVTSTIVGARRLDQLDDNLSCLDIEIPAEARAKLDEATTPTLPFPCGFLDNMAGFFGNGSNINGQQTDVFGISPEGDSDRY